MKESKGKGGRKGSRSGTVWTRADYREAGYRELYAWLPAELVAVIDDYAALEGTTRTALLAGFAEQLRGKLEQRSSHQ